VRKLFRRCFLVGSQEKRNKKQEKFVPLSPDGGGTEH